MQGLYVVPTPSREGCVRLGSVWGRGVRRDHDEGRCRGPQAFRADCCFEPGARRVWWWRGGSRCGLSLRGCWRGRSTGSNSTSSRRRSVVRVSSTTATATNGHMARSASLAKRVAGGHGVAAADGRRTVPEVPQFSPVPRPGQPDRSGGGRRNLVGRRSRDTGVQTCDDWRHRLRDRYAAPA